MKKLIAKKDFTINGLFFSKDNEVKNVDFEIIVKLNEKGFIYPLTRKELIDLKNELINKKNIYKEEE